jgi:hypothetical protein|nr:hypothetical protein [Neorhizobium tomejilense]
MKVISCLGRKGGSGKTMIAHLLAHGLSKGYGVITNVVMTDVRENKPTDINPGREYMISAISNKNPAADTAELDKIFTQTARLPDSILIIDGGANRANLDGVFAKMSDMVMIPMGFGQEDINVAESDFWNLAKIMQDAKHTGDICIIRNRWPGTERKKEALLQKKWIQLFMQKAERMQMLFPDFVPDMPSLLDMANTDDPRTTPLIDAVAARFAEVVALKIGHDLPPKRKLTQYPVPAERRTREEAAA